MLGGVIRQILMGRRQNERKEDGKAHDEKFRDEEKDEKGEEMSPLTKKGTKIMRSMKKQYGAKRGKQIFYKSANKKVIRGVHR